MIMFNRNLKRYLAKRSQLLRMHLPLRLRLLTFRATCSHIKIYYIHVWTRNILLSYYGFLRFEFCAMRFVTISAYKRCWVRLYLQLFVGWLMSYLRYLCLFFYSGVQHLLCCVLVCLSSLCLLYVASFAWLSIFNCLFGIL